MKVLKLISKDNPAKTFEVEYNDDGLRGDKADGDNVFSKEIPEQNLDFTGW